MRDSAKLADRNGAVRERLHGRAVVGSIMRATSAIRLAGKPLFCACWRIVDSSFAR